MIATAAAVLPTHPTSPAPALGSLVEALAAVPEPRGAQGRQYALQPLLLAVVYAMLCNAQHPAAVAGWVADHFAGWLRDAVGFATPNAPCRTTFYLFLRRLDWQALELALRRWMQTVATANGLNLEEATIALDGKEVRGVRTMSTEVLVLVSAFTHGTGLTLALSSCLEGQEQAAVRALLQELTLTGRVLTMDALHTQRETAQLIVDRGGHYVCTVKGNQPQLAAELEALFQPWLRHEQDRDLAVTEEKGHGRLEQRRLTAVALSPGWVDWPGAAQVFCLTRSVRHRRTKKDTFEVVYGITSLPRPEADAARLLRLNRGHWEIENRSHWVRDVTWREDAGLAYCDFTAEVLAVIRTTLLSLLRVHGVQNIAQQLRRNGNLPQEAARFLGLNAPLPVL